MNVKEIEQILQLLRDFDVAELELEREGCRLSLKKHGQHAVFPAGSAPAMIPPLASPAVGSFSVSPVPAAPATEKVESKPEVPLHSILSPIVGTFYASASPEAAAFAKVGAKITPQDTVCIIEAMKVMNEIKADVAGVIEEVLVTNGQAVEFGQVLFKVRT